MLLIKTFSYAKREHPFNPQCHFTILTLDSCTKYAFWASTFKLWFLYSSRRNSTNCKLIMIKMIKRHMAARLNIYFHFCFFSGREGERRRRIADDEYNLYCDKKMMIGLKRTWGSL